MTAGPTSFGATPIEPDGPSSAAAESMATPRVTARFRKAQHLRDKVDFERIYAKKSRASDGLLLIFADRTSASTVAERPGRIPADSGRIGLSVSRKLGGAVVRNRLKRLLREAFRLEQSELPAGFDWVVIPQDARRASLDGFRASLRQLTRRLAKRFPANAPPSGTPTPPTRPLPGMTSDLPQSSEDSRTEAKDSPR